MSTAVVDTCPIISLSLISKVELIDKLSDSFFIANAVFSELDKFQRIFDFESFKNKYSSNVKSITSINKYLQVMDYGESESLILQRT